MGTIIYGAKEIVQKSKHISSKPNTYANGDAQLHYWLEMRTASVGHTDLFPIPKGMVSHDCPKVAQGVEHEVSIRINRPTGGFTQIAEAYTMLHIDSKTGQPKYSISIEHESGRETYESNLTYEQATSKFLNWLKKYK